jgi:hemerythrin-like domain-containing protein
MNTRDLIVEECEAIKALLLEKNRKYGDSAINPIRIFSKQNATEQILVRLDDKINRIKNRQNDEDEDVIQDLIGYLILYRIALKMENENG